MCCAICHSMKLLVALDVGSPESHDVNTLDLSSYCHIDERSTCRPQAPWLGFGGIGSPTSLCWASSQARGMVCQKLGRSEVGWEHGVAWQRRDSLIELRHALFGVLHAVGVRILCSRTDCSRHCIRSLLEQLVGDFDRDRHLCA